VVTVEVSLDDAARHYKDSNQKGATRLLARIAYRLCRGVV